MIQHPLPLGTMVRYQDKRKKEVHGRGWTAKHVDGDGDGDWNDDWNGYYIVPFPWMAGFTDLEEGQEGVVFMYESEILEAIEVPA